MADKGLFRHADSWSFTDVRSISHSHVWTIKGFSQCDCRYLETSAKVKDDGPYAPSGSDNYITFRIRLHPQGNKDSNKDFTFFQCFMNTGNTAPQFKPKFKFSVYNTRSEEAATTVYTGTQQLHGYFEYIRRDLLLSHIQPQDELQLVLNITVTFEPVTKSNQTVRPPVPVSPAINDEVTRDISTAYTDRRHTDFAIVVGEREIKAHRVIIAARSPVFSAMLEAHTEETQKGRVVVSDMDFEVVEEMIRYIYTGQCQQLDVHALDLLAAADRFQIPGLKKLAEQGLRDNLSVDSACRQLMFADLYNSDAHREEALRFIISHANEILKTDNWNQMAAEHPKLITEVVAMMVGDRTIDRLHYPVSTRATASTTEVPPAKKPRYTVD